MRRRDLCAGLAAAGAGPEDERGTLYIPQAHREADLTLLHQTMEEFPFAELVTAAPSLRITHLPVWLDRKAGAMGSLYGHIARSNPQSAAIEGGETAVIVFRGPHAYISPSWYENPATVPTWNYAAVHATGRLDAVSGEGQLYELLSRLVAKSEGKYSSREYDFSKLPRSKTSPLMKGITGFRMRIDSLEGKFKLGQERSGGDRERIVRNLKTAPRERAIAEFTEAYYRRVEKRAKGGGD